MHTCSNTDVHVKTRAFKHARDILFTYKHLVLRGKPGEGKTYLALSLIADVMEKFNKVQPVQIHNAKEWEKLVDTTLPLVVFLDDVLGKYGLSETDLDRWIKTSKLIYPSLSGSSIFLIVCIRTHILASVKSSVLRKKAFSSMFNSHVVDISSESNCLTKEERLHMLLKYAPKSADINDTFAIEEMSQMKNVIGFPENCKILRSLQHLRVHWKEVFSNNMFIIEEIQEISNKNPKIYTFLVLLMICGGQLALENKMEELSSNIKLISDYCGLKEKMTIGQIKDIGQILCGTFVECMKETNIFTFQHDSIETATFISFGKDYPEVTLTKCSLKHLSKMCCVKTELDKTDGEDFLNFKISIDDTQFRVVYDRFNEGLNSKDKETFKNIAEALVWKNLHFVGYISKRVTSINDVINFVSKTDSDGHSLLIHLIYAKNTNIVERIIKNISQCCLQNHDLVKRQLLLVATNACLTEEIDMVEKLIEIQENVKTFVMFAAASTGNVSVLEMPVLQCGNINATLSITDISDLENVIKNCISYPKAVSCDNDVNLFHIACRFGRMDMVKYFMTRYPDLVFKPTSTGFTSIHFAICSGDLQLVKLLSAQVDITTKTKNGISVLHIASANDDLTIVKYLIETNQGLLQQNDKNGWTALHHAASKGSVPVIESLLEAGLDITARNNDDENILHIAAGNNNVTIVKYLIKTNPGLLQQNDKSGWNALHHAAVGGSVPVLETLIAAGLDITARNNDGDHVLHIAADDDNLTVVKYLIDINPGLLKEDDKDGSTSLSSAVSKWSVHMIDTLIAATLDITARNNTGAHILHISAANANLKIVKYLIRTNPGLLQQNDKNGFTALHHAALGGSVPVLETLIAAGLDITARNNDGDHVLHIAAYYNNLKVVKYLIDINPGLLQENDKDGSTSLPSAVSKWSVRMIETLIVARLDITARNNTGAHILHIVAANDNLRIVKYLIKTMPGLLEQNDKNGWTPLHHAASKGSVAVIESLLEAGLDITARTNNGCHALHLSAGNGNLKIVKYLIKTNPGLLQQNDKNGWTALHHAASKGSVPVLETLIAAGLDITARNNDDENILHIAVGNDNLNIVKYLIKTNPGLLQQNDKNGWTALHHAASKGSVPVIESLLAAVLNNTARNNDDENILHIAAGHDNMTIVKYLIQNYPGLLQQNDQNGWTALHHAASKGSVPVFEILLAAGLDITARNNDDENILHIAAGHDNITIVKYLIKNYPGLLQQNDQNGWNALHHAASKGSVPVIESLLAAGLNSRAKSNGGAHILHIAAANDNLRIVIYLTETNPRLLQQKDKNGWTALHHAASKGSVPVIESLLAAGLDITARNNDDENILHIAAANDNVTIVKYLIKTNPGLLQQNDKSGWNALHHAAVGGSVPVLETLIAAGLDITARNNDGDHVLHIAADYDNLTVVKYLIDINPGLLKEDDKDGSTSLSSAVSKWSVHMIDTLIAATLDITARNNTGAHILHISAANANLKIVKYLIRTNPGLLQQNDKNGFTALHHAALGGSVPVLETLIAAGLDITARNNDGDHVLHIAAYYNNLKVVKYLIDINPGLLQENDKDGSTSLPSAVSKWSVRMIETLIVARLDITARNNTGAHILHIVAANDNLRIVKYLIKTMPGLLEQNDKNGWTPLHHAASKGSVAVIESLLEAGLDITARTNNGCHALHLSAGNGNLKIVKYLIKTNPGLLQQNDKNGWTALHHAASKGSVPVLETLIAAGLDITARNNDDENILHIAVGNDNLNIVKYLIKTNPGLLQQNDKNGWTALHHAALGGSVPVLKTLIAAGLDITARNNDDENILHIAAGHDNLNIVKYLIKTNPGLLQQNDKNGWTALHHAASKGSVPVIESLLAAVLNNTARNNDDENILHIAAGHDNMTIVKYLIQNYPGLLQQNDQNGWTALYHAASKGSVPVFEILLAAGLDITARNNDDENILHIAAGHDNITIVKYLIKNYPGLLQQNDQNGWTALHHAASKGSVPVIESLLAAGLNSRAKSNGGAHILHIAAANDNLRIVIYLTETNPRLLQQKDKNGWTALHHAASKGSVPVIESLLAAGLDITARNNDDENILHIAAANDNVTIVKYLIKTNPGLLQQNDKSGWNALHHAAVGGSVPVLETLIAAGLDITARNNDGDHVLHIAADYDNLTVVKYLIDINPGLLKEDDKDGSTSLSSAVSKWSVHMIDTLIAATLDITARNNTGAHILHISAANANLKIVKYLIRTNPGLLQQNDKNGFTALHHAALGGSVPVLETLIAAGLDITARNNDGDHVLHIAAYYNNLKVVKYLIDINPGLLQENDKNGSTSLPSAVSKWSVRMIETLIVARLDITARNNTGAHILHIVAANDNLRIVKYLIKTMPGLLEQNDKNGWTALHHAASKGSAAVIESLLEAGLDITARTNNGCHALHLSAGNGNLTIVKYLIKTNPGLLQQNDKNGWTALHHAASKGSVPVIASLLAAGLDITARTKKGYHVLHISACNDNLSIVKYLIRSNPGLLQQNDKNGWTALHHAALGGSVPVLKTLIAAGLDITARNNDDENILHIAAGHDNITIVKYLIKNYPGLLQQNDQNGWTALHHAASKGSVPVIESLLAAGLNSTAKSNGGAHILHIAAANDNLRIVIYLTETKPRLLQQKDKSGSTALHHAASKGSVPVIESLLEAGLDITARNNDNENMLHIAACNDNVTIVKYLIRTNPGLLQENDKYGWTALHHSALGGSVAVIKSLLAAGLDIAAKTNNSCNVLHIAACNDNLNIVKYLIKTNPGILQHNDKNGWTALHHASSKGSVPVFESLLAAGLDITARNNDDENILHIAAGHDNITIVKYLIKNYPGLLQQNDQNGWTALHHAASKGSVPVIESLLAAGLNSTAKSNGGAHVLHIAAANDNLRIVIYLTETKPRLLQQKDKNGSTALHHAASKGSVPVIESLLEAGMDITARNNDNENMLHIAACNDNVTIVKYLIKTNPGLLQENDKYGWTALHHAALGGSVAVIKSLLAAGLDIAAKTNNSCNVLHIAACNDNLNIVKYLIKTNPGILQHNDKNGWNALHHAALGGSVAVLETLIAAGLDITARNNDGDHVLHIAANYDNLTVVKYLIDINPGLLQENDKDGSTSLPSAVSKWSVRMIETLIVARLDITARNITGAHILHIVAANDNLRIVKYLIKTMPGLLEQNDKNGWTALHHAASKGSVAVIESLLEAGLDITAITNNGCHVLHISAGNDNLTIVKYLIKTNPGLLQQNDKNGWTALHHAASKGSVAVIESLLEAGLDITAITNNGCHVLHISAGNDNLTIVKYLIKTNPGLLQQNDKNGWTSLHHAASKGSVPVIASLLAAGLDITARNNDGSHVLHIAAANGNLTIVKYLIKNYPGLLQQNVKH
ncbi:hypothetical protein ACJMK2_040269 [Sinanodonta woodiana]|uniref:Novel STAND NTPase 3 domain-containing protein n=1 Tax=Sinanodonta woodiana TaxID=1069815 RepID=A0ABD3WHY6_SINWO